MVSKWLERKIDDLILGLVPIPYADKEIVEVAEGFLGVDLPGLPHIDLSDMSTGHKILLLIFGALPVLDAEYLDLIGLNPFKGDESGGKSDDTELDLGDGAKYNPNGGGSGGSSGGSGLFSTLLKFSMIGIPIVIVLLIVGGSGYMSLASSQAGFQLAGLNTPAIGDTVAQAGKTVQCLGDAACVREWQFNNTERPGSEAVGQEYSLEIDNFAVNDGFPLDIANRRQNDRVPADFSVYNPRHGLKGIEARNVAYRIRVYDGLGSLVGLPECQTGWKPLGGEYAENDFGGNGTILPGGFATPLGTHNELTLKNCGLLQPALGIQRAVRLQIAYDYSSQSTLQVQAMSEEHLRSLDQRPGFKKSQTADTPVKTYINVESPITYRRNDDGTAESSVFGVRLGFETGQSGVKYRVDTEDFKLYDSGQTIDVNNADSIESGIISCEDIRRETQDQYTFSENMTEYLSSRQSDAWFESDSGPSPARCSMVLENPRSISPTGETLTFRVDANYTVMLEETVDGFEVQNSRCTQYECPMLVPDSHEGTEEGDLISECDTGTRVDANNGCGARLGQDWQNIDADYAINENLDAKIENGETAYKLNTLLEGLPGYVDSSINMENTVIGLESEKVENLESDEVESFAALSTLQTRNNGQDVEYQQLERILCSDYSTDRFREIWNNKHQGDLIYFNSNQKNCGENSLADYVAEWYTWGLYQSPSQQYKQVREEGCEAGVVVAGRGGLECYS